VAVTESTPPIGIDVLVTGGEDIKIDQQNFYYVHNGRLLLPSDPRRATTTPERRFARFVGVTHWLPLPLLPNSLLDGRSAAHCSAPDADHPAQPEGGQGDGVDLVNGAGE
jgi:hypothetical protein